MENNSAKNDKSHEVEVYYVPPEGFPKDIIVENPKTVSKKNLTKCKVIR